MVAIFTEVLHFQKPCIQIIREDWVCHICLQASTVWRKQPQIRCITVMRLVIHEVRILHMLKAITQTVANTIHATSAAGCAYLYLFIAEATCQLLSSHRRVQILRV
jgi:hypothetical protein